MAHKVLLWALLSLSVLAAAVEEGETLKITKRPNIVFILTDDQDIELGSLDYMPLVQKHIVSKGTTFNRHYCSTAICCPSRVTLWTGKNAHNTNVTDVFPPYGGFPKFVSQGLNENYLPVWLQEGGYNTFYTGKLFNAHTVDNYNSPYPAGWTSSDFLLDPYTYQYLNATTQRNKDKPVSWEGHYATDVIAEKAYGLIDEAVELGKPFFLTVATAAPHSNVGSFPIDIGNNSRDPLADIGGLMSSPIPAERHKHLFPNAKVPRSANFNPKDPGGVSWVKLRERLNDTVIEYNDAFYRARLQALQAVDELVGGVIQKLTDHDILDETYVIYSTDNGYHISQHRLNPGKECGFEEDIHIPLIIRGPGLAAGASTDIVTAHTDLSPTILKVAGLKAREDFDGSAIPLNDKDLRETAKGGDWSEHVNVEFWGRAIPEGLYGFSLDDGKVVEYGRNNTYKALRTISEAHNLYYAVWCTNEHELYNLKSDPSQLHNLYPSSPSSASPSATRLLQRLDALLLTTKSCVGSTCRFPWRELHPSGNVRSLEDAMIPRFDRFYANIAERVNVEFDDCALGYIKELEGPQSAGIKFQEDELEL